MDTLRFQALRAFEHLIGDPIVVLESLLLACLYVFAAHKGLWTSIVRYDEPVPQIRAVPSYPSSWHANKPIPAYRAPQAFVRVKVKMGRSPEGPRGRPHELDRLPQRARILGSGRYAGERRR